ncbi:MAG: dUTP diphosphatase [Gammaproteobacteria bacterium]
MISKAVTMLEMQDAMNRKVDEDWLDKKREWYRAVWIECSELMDHYGGWKWWKASSPDIDQVVLEIVDIWHFGLSMQITAERDYRSIAKRLCQEWGQDIAAEGFLSGVESLATEALVNRRFSVGTVRYLLAEVDRSFDDLFRNYVGKNVLNFFRQDHGYKDGSYVKIWHGKEDNVHLVELLEEIDLSDSNIKDAVYAGLKARYSTISA